MYQFNFVLILAQQLQLAAGRTDQTVIIAFDGDDPSNQLAPDSISGIDDPVFLLTKRGVHAIFIEKVLSVQLFMNAENVISCPHTMSFTISPMLEFRRICRFLCR